MKPLPNDFPDDIRQRVNSVPRTSKAQAPLEFEWIENAAVTKRKDELIAGVAGLGEIVVIHADPKVGKTQLAAFTSFVVSTGRPWFGRRVKQGAVLYLALEKVRVTRKRFRAMQLLNSGIRPPIAVSAGPVDLTQSRDVNAVIATVSAMAARGDPVRLIVVDTLNRAFGGEDENSAGTVGKAFNALTRIAIETNACIFLLHHNSKNRQQLRGSTAIVASADVVISLSRDEGDDRVAEVTDANDALEGQQFHFRMPTYELEEATESHPAETTVLIEPIDQDEYEGRARRSAPAGPSNSDLLRSRNVRGLFDQLAVDGRCDRRELLSLCRDQEVVSPHNPNSSAEQFRKALLALKSDGSLDFDNKSIWTQHKPNPKAQQPASP